MKQPADVGFCEGLRMPAGDEHCHALAGRRRQAFKEGTRGTMRR